MGSMGVLNGKVFGMLLGKLLFAQQDIIGVLNGKLGAGHYWSAQWEFIIRSAGVLNGNLCAQWEL